MSAFNFFFVQNIKDLCLHFEQQGVTPDHYYISWCLTLFCRLFPLDIVSRIWDNFFLEEEIFCIKAALGDDDKIHCIGHL
ncbi:unnamed protein product [Heterosigma akashiwo]